MFEETVYQKSDKNDPLIHILKNKGIVPIIKLDKGLKPLAGTIDETITEGLDNLDSRCQEMYSLGCRAAKWRAVFVINYDNATPSCLALDENAHTLARYAATCQANGLVPIVEPEVLMDGIHSIDVASKITEKVLSKVFAALVDHDVMLEGILLKPNMVRSGASSPMQSHPIEVAQQTLKVLSRTVPVAVPGIFFLSGGMSELDSTLCLNEINKEAAKHYPWYLSFSYGRALQKSCLNEWQGKHDVVNIANAQKTLLRLARQNSLATCGKFDHDVKSHHHEEGTVISSMRKNLEKCYEHDSKSDESKHEIVG